jgi:N-acetylmuramoyl-L-alanine amidase
VLKYFIVVGVVLTLAAAPEASMEALPAKKGKRRQPFIINYQKHLNRRFKKVARKSTRFIIIHTSEAGLSSTLRTVSKGKSVGRYRTIGGHTNYLIARDGQIYRILHHYYRADHAGLSMWNGLEDISSHSLGIELVGYHYHTITDQQYRSLSRLLKILQRMYDVADKNVLTHSQVSFGRPNMWFPRPHRGRKRCALNFEREKAGLKDAWNYDPDVRAGRLARDRHIYAMFYKKHKTVKPAEPSQEEIITSSRPVEKPGAITQKNAGSTEKIVKPSNVISMYNTAWNIAGEDYDDPSTLYLLPDNISIRGDLLEKRIGWDRIPTGTRVLLNQPMGLEEKKGPIFEVTREYTAWSFAGENYQKSTTIYFLPGGRLKPGNQISDWDSLPDGTRMIIGYKGPYTIQARKGQTPWGIAGRAHNHPETVYVIPGKGLITGDQVEDFSDLPRGSKLFLKINN